jgi:predicted transcriptional regulator
MTQLSTELFQLDPIPQGTRRSTMEIMCDVLDVVASGVEKPTHIIYHANISWKVLNEMLRVLIANKLLTKDSEGKRAVYKLTDKGFSALNLYKDLKLRLTGPEREAAPNRLLAGF